MHGESGSCVAVKGTRLSRSDDVCHWDHFRRMMPLLCPENALGVVTTSCVDQRLEKHLSQGKNTQCNIGVD